MSAFKYRQTSNISYILVGTKLVDHSDVVGDACQCAVPTTSSFSIDLAPGFNGLGKENCKTRRESFKFCDLVQLILESLRYYTKLQKQNKIFNTHLGFPDCVSSLYSPRLKKRFKGSVIAWHVNFHTEVID